MVHPQPRQGAIQADFEVQNFCLFCPCACLVHFEV